MGISGINTLYKSIKGGQILDSVYVLKVELEGFAAKRMWCLIERDIFVLGWRKLTGKQFWVLLLIWKIKSSVLNTLSLRHPSGDVT